MITELGLNTLEKLMNAYLRLDPDCLKPLHSYHGKTARVVIADWKFDFYLQVSDSGFYLSSRPTEEISTSIEGNLFDLFKMVCARGAQPTLVSQHIKIGGDLDFGQALYKTMSAIDIDWEEHLSRLVGDTVAHQVMQQGHKAFNVLKRSLGLLRDNTQEYIQEEARFSPSIAEVEDFYADIAKLRNDVDRTEKKIELLLRNRE